MQNLLVGLAAFLFGLMVGLVVWIRAKGAAESERTTLKEKVATLEAEKGPREKSWSGWARRKKR
ncbi:MAG: hypothetical protein R6T96_00870 [Longimicrobiales bacterium]